MCETKVTYPWEVTSPKDTSNEKVGVTTVKEFEESFKLPTVYVPSIQYPYGLWKIVYTVHPTKSRLNKR